MLAEDRVRLRHMIKAAEATVQFLAGRQRIDLDEDRLLLFANEFCSKKCLDECTVLTYVGLHDYPQRASQRAQTVHRG
jgi:hypothetical protein